MKENNMMLRFQTLFYTDLTQVMDQGGFGALSWRTMTVNDLSTLSSETMCDLLPQFPTNLWARWDSSKNPQNPC